MPRKALIRSQEHPYHVTARANNREDFPAALSDVWRVFSDQFNEISERFGARVHAFVLMPNHFHLLISAPKEDLGVIMQLLMRAVTKKINTKTGRSGRIFGAKYHWSLIRSEQYYDYALKYCYRNPAKAKLVDQVEEYSYSTLNCALARTKLSFSLHPHFGTTSLISNGEPDAFLTWLNQPFKSELDLSIKKALLKTQFAPPKFGWRNVRIELTQGS